jgi:hypothetical protein
MEDGAEDKCRSPEKNSLTKSVYVEGKIKGEINSEKVFNTPQFHSQIIL